jgi:hypothetical protein
MTLSGPIVSQHLAMTEPDRSVTWAWEIVIAAGYGAWLFDGEDPAPAADSELAELMLDIGAVLYDRAHAIVAEHEDQTAAAITSLARSCELVAP